MTEILHFLQNAFVSPITLYATIVITLLFLWWYCRHLLFGVERARARFGRAANILKAKNVASADGAARTADPVSGLRLFPQSPRLQQQWTRFVADWTRTVGDGESEEGSVDVGRYFEPDQTLGNDSYFRKLESIPGRLLSLGILGTFIGLAYGLPTTGNQEQIIADTFELISGLKTAFVTSIFGIIYSLIFLVTEKALVGRATAAVLEFQAAARSLYPVLEPEVALGRIARAAAEQVDSLRTLENDLGATLSESFGGAVEEHLAPLIDQIRETVSRATDASAQVQIEGLQTIIDRFMSGMNEQLGGSFEQLGSTIETASTNLGGLADRLEAASASQAAIMERTSQTAEVLERQLPHLLSFGEKLDRASVRFNEAIEGLAGLDRALTTGMEQLIAAQGASGERFKELLDRLDSSAALVNSTAQAQKETQERMEAAYREALESFERGIKDGLIQSLNSFDSVLGDILERFSGTLADLKEQYDALNKHSQALKDGVEMASTQIAANLVEVGDASTKAHERIKELSEAYVANLEGGLTASNAVIGRLEAAAGGISRSLDKLQGDVGRIAARVEDEANSDRRGGWLSGLRGSR